MPEKRMVVFGIDGADPKTMQALLKKGLLPNIAEFNAKNRVSRLETVYVSQSPVAWASFMTGTQPGRHGVTDFIIRNPKTMQLQLGLVNEKIKENKIVYERILQEKPVWETINNQSTALFIPVSFPPKPFNGRILCGMGIPDARGTQGVSVVYTEKNAKKREEIVSLQFKGNKTESFVIGAFQQKEDMSIKRNRKGLYFEIQNQKFFVKQNTWSDWIYITFSGVETCFRIKVLSVEKGKTEFYLSPVIHSPRKPFIPISFPEQFAREIKEKVGNYKPVSFESDVFGLKEELIDEKTWLEDMHYTMLQRVKTADFVLKNYKWKFFCIDLFGVDRVQHLFYRYIDKKHALYEDSFYREEIEKVYIKADEYIGLLAKNLSENDFAFIISDHGFGPYRENVNINQILMQEGFLKLKDKQLSRHLGDIDFEKTLAYSVGFGSIYLNIKNRECFGIIEKRDIESVKQNIISALKKYRFNGKKVFLDAIDSTTVYGENSLTADIIPIFPLGKRASRENTIGCLGLEKEPVFLNKNKWSGDHIGPHLLEENPGIIVSNQDINLENASILDLAPTVHSFFSIKARKEFDGKPLI